jgi:hypothetical protein
MGEASGERADPDHFGRAERLKVIGKIGAQVVFEATALAGKGGVLAGKSMQLAAGDDLATMTVSP